MKRLWFLTVAAGLVMAACEPAPEQTQTQPGTETMPPATQPAEPMYPTDTLGQPADTMAPSGSGTDTSQH